MRLSIKKGWLSTFVVVFVFLTASAAYGHAPQINLTISDTTPLVCQGEDVCLSIRATDSDAGNTITITKISGAGTFNPVSGSSPLNAQHCFFPDTSGKYRFIFKATDNNNNSHRDTLDITVSMEFQPKFFVNGNQIQPVGGCQQDVLTSFCNPKQNWKLLNEYTPHNNLNRYGFYTDLGVGSNRTVIFPGPDSPGARETTMIASSQQVGLWLLNDLNNNGIFDGSDSFLFSERALTAGSGMNEHQWFMVFDVRAHKGTGATYFFNTSTEDITLTGDYDYLIFIDDDHTNSNFDHNDMVVGVTEIASPPEVICPANIVKPNTPGQCGATATYSASCTNSCGNCSVTCAPASGSFFPVGATTVTCIATNSTNLKDTCTFTVTVTDTQKPTVSCPANITTTNTAGQCAANVSYTATAADNCPGMTLVCTPASGSSFPVGTTTVKCKATDAAGNKDSCQFTVAVNDTEPPSANCPANITTNNTSGQCAANVSYTATASDNCPGATVACTPPSGSSFPVGTTTVTCVATDAGGKKDTCEFTVTVNDTEPPVAVCPANYYGILPVDSCCKSLNLTASATDNCPGATIVCSPPLDTCFPVGTTTVTCVATDAAGNTDNCQFTVTVHDENPPVAQCPADITINNDPGQCEALVNFTATVNDDCPGATIVCTPPSGSSFSVGTTTVKCIATDASGNKDSCQFTVTVNDTENPTISCPPNIVKGNDPGQCDTTVTYTAIATDNCPGVSYVCTPPSGSTFPVGTTTVTCTATDASGNQASCQFTVTVNDTQDPTIVCSPPIVTGTDPGRCDAVVTYTVTASNGCPGVTLVCTPPSGSTFPKGVTTVNCTATDAAGNQANCSFTITVNDDEKPVVTCPANITTNTAPGRCDAIVNYNASASDNCPGVSLVCTPPSGFTFPVGTTNVKCIATDGSGNKDSCQFTVTVNDTQKPTVTCPANITMNTAPGRCDANVTYTATPGDNCPGVSLVCTPPSGSVFPKGVNPVNCVVTDASGNKDSCQFTVTVNDTQKPTVSCPANITTNVTSGQCNATVNYTATSSDNCSGVTLVCTPPSGSSFSSGTTTVTCVAADGAGNKDSCQFTVTVTDQTPPEITCPANITKSTDPGQCNTTASYTATASDNCSGATVVCSPPSGSSFNKGVNTVTCVATDAAGNKDTCQFTVTVNDTEKPAIICPASATAENIPGECRALVSFVGNVSYADNCPGASLTCMPPSGSYYPVGNTLVRCTVTDASGNKDSCQFVVGVVQTSPGCDTTTTPCLELQIAKIENAYQGSDVEVPIDNISQFVDSTTLPNPSGIGGFSFLISYDCACLQFLGARKGQLLEAQGWEFFTYRYGAIGNGNCGSGCPSCLIRIVAIADVNNGANHPTLTRDNQGQWAVLKFRVTNDRRLEGQFCQVNWYWFDCTDNTVSDSTGNQLWVVKELTTFGGTPIDLFTAFPNNVADCDEFSGGPGKPSPKKRICFRNGGIDIPRGDEIDDRGDLNLNGFGHEVGDAVLYENYFIYGPSVLDSNYTRRQAQLAASDVNGDGLILSVSDLVALLRVLTGDAVPLPKANPNAAAVNLSWTASGSELKIATTSASELGGLFVSFKYSGTAEKMVTFTTPADGMQPKVNAEVGELRILIDSDRRGAKLPAGEVNFTVPFEGQVEFVEAQASNYQGQPLPVVAKTSALPTQFDLSQNYPNPFNPKTNFTLSMPTAGHYKITIYNLLGEAVRTFEGEAPAGRQVFTWDGTDGRGRAVSSGVYLYKAEVGKQVINKKMVLMR